MTVVVVCQFNSKDLNQFEYAVNDRVDISRSFGALVVCEMNKRKQLDRCPKIPI